MPDNSSIDLASAGENAGADGGGPQVMEIFISRVLFSGLVLSTLVVIAGGALLLTGQGGNLHNVQSFHGEPMALSSLGGIVSTALALRPKAIIQLGLLLLVATPITRVGLSVLLFWRKKDYLYVGITSVVLTILLLAISDER
jgi:uncharacterized membrane protein